MFFVKIVNLVVYGCMKQNCEECIKFYLLFKRLATGLHLAANVVLYD